MAETSTLGLLAIFVLSYVLVHLVALAAFNYLEYLGHRAALRRIAKDQWFKAQERRHE